MESYHPIEVGSTDMFWGSNHDDSYEEMHLLTSIVVLVGVTNNLYRNLYLV